MPASVMAAGENVFCFLNIQQFALEDFCWFEGHLLDFVSEDQNRWGELRIEEIFFLLSVVPLPSQHLT